MPHAVVQAFAREIPALRASESITRAAETAVGSGSLKKEASRKIMRGWRKVTQRGGGSATKPKSFEEMEMRLAQLGIRSKKV